MTVNLTRIYTRLGDDGETHLGDMSRVSKLDPHVEAYGTVDELNATIGVALAQSGMPVRFAEWLTRVQNDLLDVGADLSVPGGAEGVRGGSEGAGADREELGAEATRSPLRITGAYTEWLEAACDEVNDRLPPLRSFLLPGGTPAAAQLHVCRTVCRRAERRVLAVGGDVNPEVVRYLNRLSDLLFILARGVSEGEAPLWEPGGKRSRAGSAPAG
jgi:cob(I)alamin adenosyltransferase